jgi:hypothetical protein
MRYFFGFTASKIGQEGLSPTFLVFKKESDLSDQAAPTVHEVSDGLYYCDYAPAANIVFVLDGGADLDVRTIFGRFTPQDEGVSQILAAIAGITGLTQEEVIEAVHTRSVLNKTTGAFTVYKADKVTPLVTGIISSTETTAERLPD